MVSPDASTGSIWLWVFGLCAGALGLAGLCLGWLTRSRSEHLVRQLEREKLRADKVAHFVIPLGLALATESEFDRLLEKILLEAKALAHADGGTLYLATPERTLRFVMVQNDTLKFAMGGTSGAPVTLPPLPMYDEATGRPNESNIATSCALGARAIAIADVYSARGFDFSGTKAFDQRMNYRTVSVLCVPLKDTRDGLIGVLQLINARDPEKKTVIPFDPHLCQMLAMLAMLAAAALTSYLRIKTLTDQITELKIQVDEVKKDRQVAEITGSDYFKDLQARAREMRAKAKGQ